MHGGRKKLIHKDSSIPSFPETKTESELPASQLSRALDKKSNLEGKQKSKSNIGFTLSKYRDSGGKRLLSTKILNKALDEKSSKKHSSSKLTVEGAKSSLSNPKRNAKDADADGKLRKLKRRAKKKKQDNVELDEPLCLKRRTRYLLIKMKLEQNLIDAYSAEGWKGQSCAFYQKCLDPPLETEKIPPEDQGWFCKFCDCKMEVLEAMNAHLGTHFSVDSHWENIFREEAAFPAGGGGLLKSEELWPSDDSEDEDYKPEKRECSCNVGGEDNNDNASEDTRSSTSLSWSLDGEVFSGSRMLEGLDSKNHSVIGNLDSDDTTTGEIVAGSRRRSAVDYKKLYDDAVAGEQVSEDEDWGPTKRRRREKESDAASTLMTLCESEKQYPNVEVIEVDKKPPSGPQNRRPFFRIPSHAVEKLRQVFADNELPSKVVRENLSKELGLEPEKVSKWFKNARYVSLKTRKVIVEFGDISLKKQLKLLKEKTKEEKRANFMASGCGSQEVELEMGRLLKAKSRLQHMERKLLRFKTDKGKKSRESYEQCIIHVPIAELRERF